MVSRAGLVWEIFTPTYVEEVLPPDADRWGVWGVSFGTRMRTHDEARLNLASTLPELRARWEAWRTGR
jgi:hypothetical protein